MRITITSTKVFVSHRLINTSCTTNRILQTTLTTDVYVVVIDGGWTEWNDWSDCPADFCSYGNMTRNRTCDNPAPLNGGLDCEGESMDVMSCYNDSCPSESMETVSLSQYQSQSNGDDTTT